VSHVIVSHIRELEKRNCMVQFHVCSVHTIETLLGAAHIRPKLLYDYQMSILLRSFLMPNLQCMNPEHPPSKQHIKK